MGILNEKNQHSEYVRESILHNIDCLRSAIETNKFDTEYDTNFLIRVDNVIEKWLDELLKLQQDVKIDSDGNDCANWEVKRLEDVCENDNESIDTEYYI